MKRLVAGIAVVLSVVACATAPAQDISRADAARQAEALLISRYRADGPGAAVLVARGATVLFRGARGEADVGAHTPLQPDSVFRIGSITKQFTAAALLTLVEDGRANLDDPLSRYLPDFPGGERITLLQLLNHTSGVRNFNGLPGYIDGINRDLTTAEIIALFRDEPADFAPGENWAYSNSGYVLLGAVIEAVTGMPWHAYMEQRFFRPLGMNHTGYGHEPRFAAQQVGGYSFHEGQVVPMRAMSMTQPHAAGALVSTVDDLFTWSRALHEGRVLRSDIYARMIAPEGKAAGEGIRYGFGVFNDTMRGRQALTHGGRIFGFMSALTYVPGPDITVIVLENDDAHNGPEHAEALSRRLVAVALGEPYPEATAVPIDAAALQALEGVYSFDGDVTRTLRIVDGRLTGQRGAGPRTPLTPIGADDFLYEDGFNRLKIERDATGAIAAVRFFANGDGAGARGVRTGGLDATPTGLQLPRAALERLVGVYASNELTVTVALDGETLTAQIAGQDAFRLLATTPTQFDVEQAGATVEFAPDTGPAAELILRQGGREMSLRRTP